MFLTLASLANAPIRMTPILPVPCRIAGASMALPSAAARWYRTPLGLVLPGFRSIFSTFLAAFCRLFSGLSAFFSVFLDGFFGRLSTGLWTVRLHAGFRRLSSAAFSALPGGAGAAFSAGGVASVRGGEPAAGVRPAGNADFDILANLARFVIHHHRQTTATRETGEKRPRPGGGGHVFESTANGVVVFHVG